MKRFTPLMLALFFFVPSVALAHSGAVVSDQADIVTETSAVEVMKQMEDSMMGGDVHARMEGLMSKMLNGDLSAEEQQEIIDVMQDTEMGPGMMTMMMRRMGPGMMQQGEFTTPTGMMGFGTGLPVYWITMVLFWILIISGIAATWRWINKKK